VIGVVAVVVGSVLMLDRFGILNAGNVLRFWPVILIVVGLNNIIRDRTRGGLVGGGMMVIFGTIFLATQFGYVRWSQTWPIIIIGWGLLLIWDALRPKAYPSAQLDGSGRAVFGSVEKQIVAQDFREASVESVFGSTEVDFIRAEMAEDKAFLNVSCVFGSVEVRIPTHWNVIIEANAVFGASENKTRPPVPTPTPKTLVIRGDAVFGSIEVKN
jgi:predicted membrane protein